MEENQTAVATKTFYEQLFRMPFGLHDRRFGGGEDTAVSAASSDKEDGAFEIRERWEGVVEEVWDTYFTATVRDTISGDAATVEIEIEDVSPTDLKLLTLGSLFYWYIGYQQKRNGARLKVSYIHFRRARHVTSDPTPDPSMGWLAAEDANAV